jgi:hypothetical protein
MKRIYTYLRYDKNQKSKIKPKQYIHSIDEYNKYKEIDLKEKSCIANEIIFLLFIESR